MRVTPKKITVRELVDGYEENPDGRIVGWGGKIDRGYVNGERKYSRILIRNKRCVDQNQ